MSLLDFVRGNRKQKGTLPNIVCVHWYVDERTVIIPPRESVDTTLSGAHPSPASLYPIQTRSGENRTEKYYFAHVVFENQKRLHRDTRTAERVVAHIVFYDTKDKDILNRDFIGRWGNSIKQPKTREDLDVEENNHWVDMFPNGTRYELDIVMKHKSETNVFAFNNTSYWYPEFRGIENILDGNEFVVKVTLRGSNIDPKEFKFRLVNNGKNNNLDISKLGT